MAPHSSTLAWKIPWTEEPGRLQSMGSRRVRHDWASSLSLFTFLHWRRKWQPTPVFLPGGSQGRGAWWAAVYGVAQSRTRLKRLGSSGRALLRVPCALHCVLISYLFYTRYRQCTCVNFNLPIHPVPTLVSIHLLSLCVCFFALQIRTISSVSFV